MKDIINSVMSFLFPKRCPCCGEVRADGLPCERCSEALRALKLDGECCLKCGAKVEACSCSEFNPLYSGVVCAYENAGAAKNGIYGLKFKGKFYAADFFGKKMAETFKTRLPEVEPDVICIVPMTARERRKKGCDQVHLLAKPIAEALNVGYEPGLLVKIKETGRQHKLLHGDRAANVKDAFRTDRRLDDKTVLLIDDIKTTGHTLSECAKQLRLGGAKEVWCLTALCTVNRSCKERKKQI